jgi:ABC-type nitrate/sulfonate/bicarbonate transport system substrate-binding protein
MVPDRRLEMKRMSCIIAIWWALITAMAVPSQAQAPQSSPSDLASTSRLTFKAAVENGTLEWFFLLVDAGKDRDIWAKNGLQPEFVPAAASFSQLKDRVESGAKIGFSNAAEVTLARSLGTPVKTVAGYFGETTARIFVGASDGAKEARDLDGKRIGIVAATHTSYRTVLYMNKILGINAEPVVLGSLQDNLAALKAGQIEAFYSAEGAALTLVEAGDLRLLLPLSDIYPKPYTAVVVWTTDDMIENNPDLVRRFVKATLEIVAFLKAHPSYASELYVKRTGSLKAVGDKAVSSLNQVLSLSGRGSEENLLAAVAGNWQFIVESGAVLNNPAVNIEQVVDERFLPSEN